MTDKLPEIMTKLQQQMGREPPATVTNIEDYAPKHEPDLKAEAISIGLREAIDRMAAVHIAERKKLDEQAELLRELGEIILKMEGLFS